MTSFIISSQLTETLTEETNKLLSTYNIDQFDITTIKREVDEKTDKMKASLGVADVKKLQQKIFLKPFKSETKAIILKEADLLTTEAQNALLKVLEEPPAHTIIVLQTNDLQSLLPTILSRCQIIKPHEPAPEIPEEEKAIIRNQLHTISSWGIGESLNQAEKLSKNKQDLIQWLEKALHIAREEMLLATKTSQKTIFPQLIKQLQTTHTTISKTNANPRLVLESLFLSFSHT